MKIFKASQGSRGVVAMNAGVDAAPVSTREPAKVSAVPSAWVGDWDKSSGCIENHGTRQNGIPSTRDSRRESESAQKTEVRFEEVLEKEIGGGVGFRWDLAALGVGFFILGILVLESSALVWEVLEGMPAGRVADAGVSEKVRATFWLIGLTGALGVGLLTLAWQRLVREARRIGVSLAAQRRSESRLRLTLDAARIGDWEMDLGTRHLEASIRQNRILGFPESFQWTFDQLLERVPIGVRQDVAEGFERSVLEKRDWSAEFPFLAEDGSERWIWVHGRIFEDPLAGGSALSGKTPRGATMFGVTRETTWRRKTEALLAWELGALALCLGEKPLRELLQSFLHGLKGLDSRNSYALFLLEPGRGSFRLGASIGLSEEWIRVIEKRGFGSEGFGWNVAVSERRQVIVEEVADHPKWGLIKDLAFGSQVRACWSTPIIASPDRILGVFVVFLREPRAPTQMDQDWIVRVVSMAGLALERRRSEDVVRRMGETLEARVAERTRQLEQANEELDAFSYSVSHDLRAPLRAVDGFSRLLLDQRQLVSRLNAEDRRMLGLIRSEAQRMSRLIDDLLTFSRIGRQQLEPEAIDMRAMAQSVFEAVVLTEPDRKFQFRLGALPEATGSAAMIRQVWQNLIGNAVKFTRGREVAVIEVSSTLGERGELVYRVQDNGVGFDMRYAGKLFGVFQRLHDASQFEGTGVGLSLVRRIIKRHGGEVWAAAEPERGATFFFTLPRIKT